MQKELKEIFHELSPKERMKAMRSTMVSVGKEIRTIARNDLSSLSYTVKRNVKTNKPGKNNAKALRRNIILTTYRRRIGFHVTVANRSGKAGSHVKTDHQNRYGKFKPAARWLETGTQRQEAHPYMENATQKLDSYESKIKRVFEEKVAEIAGKHNG